MRQEPEYLPETAAQSTKDAAEMPGLVAQLAGARTQVNEGTIGREAIQCCDPDTGAHGTFLYTGADHNESGSRVSPIFSNYGDLCAWCKVNGWPEEAGVRIYHKDKDQGKVGVGYDPAGEEPEIRTFSEATGVTTTFDDLHRFDSCSRHENAQT